MLKKWLSMSLVLLLLAALSGSLTGCGDETDASDLESFAIDDRGEKPINVEVQEIRPATFVEYIEVPGEVQAEIASTISAEEAGSVAEILYDKGKRVHKGDVLLRLDGEVLARMYDEAAAAYESAKIRFQRQKNLFKQNAVSEQQFLDAKFGFERAEAAMKALKARLEKINVKSPITGIVDNRYVDVGEFVAPGTPLVEVIAIDRVKVNAGVPERYIPDIRKSSPVYVTIDVLGDKQFSGKITFIGSTINPANRTFPVEVVIANPDHIIKPNMLARLHIQRVKYENGIVVPRDVLIETETGKRVFIAENGYARLRKVEIIAAAENQALIQGDVHFGDMLIVRGHRDLVNGEKIEVQNQQ